MPNLVGIGNSQVPTNAMLGGLAYQDSVEPQTIAKIKAKTSDNAQALFVYDTRKDSDGGAWRHRTQGTSWYNEGANPRRGARKEFPAVAVIVVTEDDTRVINIYDGDDPDLPLWMKIDSRDSQWKSTEFSSIFALNGIIALGSASTEQTNYETRNRLDLFDFIKDKIISSGDGTGNQYYGDVYGITSGYNPGWQSFTMARGADQGETHFNLISHMVWSVTMKVLPNAPIDPETGIAAPTIALGTETGMVVIHPEALVNNFRESNTSITRVTSNNTGYDAVNLVRFTTDNKIAFTEYNGPSGANYGWMYVVDIPSSDAVIGVNGKGTALTWYDSRFPLAFQSGQEAHIFSDYNYTGHKITSLATGNNRIFAAVINSVSGGMTFLQESRGTHHGGLSAYVRKNLNTGWMPAECELATLCHCEVNTETPEMVTGGNFANASDWSLGTGWAISGNQAVHTGSAGAGYLNQATSGGNNFVQDKWYQLTFDIPSGSATGMGIVNHHSSGINQPHRGVNYVDVYAIESHSTSNKGYALWRQNSTNLQQINLYSTADDRTIDNVSIKEIQEEYYDRSVGTYGTYHLIRFGSITRTPVRPGADLLGYSGFSANNFLIQPYNANLDFTTSFTIMFWVKDWALSTNLMHRGTYTRNQNCSFHLYNDGGYDYRLMLSSNGSNELNYEMQLSTNISGWHHVCFTLSGGIVRGYINGEERKCFGTGQNSYGDARFDGNVFSQATHKSPLRIGQGVVASYAPFTGSLSLLRMSNKAVSDEQLRTIVNDESRLFQENAKCTLYGTSDRIRGLDFDETTELLHVGTSSGRSDFDGLQRINNTTTAVTDAISASNGLIAEQ